MDRHEIVALVDEWWAQAVAGGYRADSPQQVRDAMVTWMTDLDAAMHSEPFDPSPARRIGTEFVAAELVLPAAMIPTTAIWARLFERSSEPDRGERFGALQGAVADGFTSEILAVHARSKDALERFRAVFDNAAIAIAIYDAQGITLEANAATAKMVGYDRAELVGMPGLNLTHPADRDKLRALIVDLRRRGHGTLRFEGRFLRRDGSVGHGEWTMTLMHAAQNHDIHLLAVGEDTTERVAAHAQLRWLATHDPLTGLFNRRYLLDRLAQISRDSGPGDQVGVCLVDLDAFKLINDIRGHGAGDQLLSELGRRLDAALSAPSITVARLGGDEFVAVLAPPCDRRKIAAAAEAILVTLRRPLRVEGDEPLTISASIGAVLTDAANLVAEKVLADADSELYRAKADGRDSWALGIPTDD